MSAGPASGLSKTRHDGNLSDRPPSSAKLTFFGLPVRFIGAPGFGSAVETATPARIIQIMVKYRF